MITELKPGYVYRWIGEKKRPQTFNQEGLMDFIMDGKPHLCINRTYLETISVSFADDPSEGIRNWRSAYPFLEEIGKLTIEEWSPLPWWWTGKSVKCRVWDEDSENVCIKYICGVNPDKYSSYVDEDGEWWQNAEPILEIDQPVVEFFLTKKLNGEITAETKLTREQLKELGL